MSGCCFEEIEAHVFEELSPARAAKVREHLAACPACAADHQALRAERSLFAARAEHERRTEAPPSFAEVLARSRGEVIPRWRRRAVSLGLGLAAAAAMIAGVFMASRDGGAPVRLAEGPVVEAPPEFSCYEGEPTSMEDSAHGLDRAIARLEIAYGACLLPTSSERPAQASPRFSLEGASDEAGQCVISTSVTSASLWP